MLVLALDTSTSQGGVAVLRDENVLSRAVWARQKSHSEFLTPTIESCLAEAGVAAKDLDMIAVGKGPGSFTGIRIAINAARSLAYAIAAPTMAFDTLDILAEGVNRKDLPLLAIVNAHKNLLYTSVFRWNGSRWHRDQAEPQVLSPEEIASIIHEAHLCVGDGFIEYERVFDPGLRSLLVRDPLISDYPLPEILGRMASIRSGSDPTLDWKGLQALYIRVSGAEEKIGERHQGNASQKQPK